MTWRTFFYCSLCSAAALVVASAAISGGAHDAPVAGTVALALQSLPAPALSDPTRTVSFVLGLAAVALTFQKAWQNMRRPS